MMRAGRLGEEEPHWITLVTKSRLDANEDVAKLLSEDKQLLPVGVQGTWGWPPVFLESLGVQAQLLVLWHGHLVRDVQVLAVISSFSVVQNGFHELLVGFWKLTNVIAVLLQSLQDLVDRAENVEVGSRSYVTLVWREAEDSDANFLVPNLLLPQLGPLDGPVADALDTVVQSVTLSRSGVSSGEDDWLKPSVELWERDLQRHLDGVQSQGRVTPLLCGLENERQGDHVRHVQGLEGLNGLWVVLASRASDERESGQGDDGVDIRPVLVERVEEELLDRAREVESASEDWNDLGTSGFEVHDGRGVVSLVPGN
mmetsp:Transcript_5501/g.10002  ORF Transcript_5501/g.10002 Transcript_5501/m.10002 type:complete len:313 (-) Transcript_5501:1163-2101(-)